MNQDDFNKILFKQKPLFINEGHIPPVCDSIHVVGKGKEVMYDDVLYDKKKVLFPNAFL